MCDIFGKISINLEQICDFFWVKSQETFGQTSTVFGKNLNFTPLKDTGNY